MSDIKSDVIAPLATAIISDAPQPPARGDVVDRISNAVDGASEEAILDCLAILCVEDRSDGTIYVRLRGTGPQAEAAAHSSDELSGPSRVSQSVDEAGQPTDERFGRLPVLEDVGHEEVPDIAADAYYERTTAADKTDVQVVTKALDAGMNVVLKGPPGVGKSYLAKYICAQTNRPLYRVTLSETTYREDLLGHLQLVSAPGGESVTSWVDGPLTRAVREGGVLLLDEINAADANTAAALNAVMERENTRSLTIPQTGEVITPHEQFRVIATANPGYQGTYEQNAAFEGRFRHIELDYVPPEIEVEIIFERTDIDRRKEEQVKDLVDFATRLREAYLNGELTTPITTRELVRIATFMETGFMDLRTAAESELLARVDDHDTSLVATLLEKSL
ncbi:AAA family ATPase [Halostella salina]|uniref:AAA family ATPase n=1 Tax=Halostella salina TaxID=1547897 RepID=UPI000EF78215|nr:AAA family ATPase [Halostella salina]